RFVHRRAACHHAETGAGRTALVLRILDGPLALQPADGPHATFEPAQYPGRRVLPARIPEIQPASRDRESRVPILPAPPVPARTPAQAWLSYARHGLASRLESGHCPQYRLRLLEAHGPPPRYERHADEAHVPGGRSQLLAAQHGRNPLS